jgi:hypothetical protein
MEGKDMLTDSRSELGTGQEEEELGGKALRLTTPK